MTAKRFEEEVGIAKFIDNETGKDYSEYNLYEIVELLNELHEEKEEMQKKMNRLYNYFEDFFSEEMGNDDFAEQWEFVADDEKWD